MIKQLMIPVAAFAVTVTGASAFNGGMLEKLDIDLSESQVSALEEVHQLREDGAEREEIKAVLEDAGLDKDAMKEIHEAVREVRDTHREAVQNAVASGDYDAFTEAIADTPLSDAINSEDDFDLFAEAQELRKDGDREGAREIMDELGIEKPEGHRGNKGGMRGEHDGQRGEGGQRGDFGDRGAQDQN